MNTNDKLKIMAELKAQGYSNEQIVALVTSGNLFDAPTTVGSAKAEKPKVAKGGKAKAKGTGAKAPKGDFDRAKYVECAKALGCYNAEYDKVVATIEDGKVVRTAKKNRELVYAEMAK